MDRVTHGVIRVNSESKGTIKINGKKGSVAYVMPPSHVKVEGPPDMVVTSWGALEGCSMKDLRAIVKWLGLKTEARTKAGLLGAIERQTEKNLEMQG